MIKHLFLFVLFSSIALPSSGQYRAIQSSAGGIASSPSYAMKLTVGEPIQGLSITSNADTLITGFYLGNVPVFVDTRGPIIFFSDIGGIPITPLSETPPENFVHQNAKELAISTQITDQGSGVEEATLFYKEGGMSSFLSIPMNGSADNFSGTIDAAEVTSKGIEYYIEARDSLDNLSRSPVDGSYGVQIFVESPGLQRSFLGDTTLAGYRLISIPLLSEESASSSVLADLGPYDITSWRFFALKPDYSRFQGNEQYEELENNATFNPGNAFWLISRENWTLQTGQAISLPTNEPFTLDLNEGWNFVGNPFNFPISATNISLSNGTLPEPMAYNLDWENSSTLNPFTGYAIDAGEGENLTLTINPISSPVSGGKQAHESSVHSHSLDWGIQIKAEGRITTDLNNRIGVSNDASETWDYLDRPEPPVIGDFVSLSFPHPDWGKIHTRYTADIRPPPLQGDSWNFEVITGTPQPVQLSFEGVREVPAEYSVELIDTINKTTYDLRHQDTYTINSAGEGNLYPLTIVIGERGYVDDTSNSLDLIPDGAKLDQNYPNPFNPTTSIRYAVSNPSVVTLEVYNSLGQVVATLVNQESRQAGYHIATWNARSDDGSAVSSGLYLYRLTVTSTDGSTSHPVSFTRKMMLIK